MPLPQVCACSSLLAFIRAMGSALPSLVGSRRTFTGVILLQWLPYLVLLYVFSARHSQKGNHTLGTHRAHCAGLRVARPPLPTTAGGPADCVVVRHKWLRSRTTPEVNYRHYELLPPLKLHPTTSCGTVYLELTWDHFCSGARVNKNHLSFKNKRDTRHKTQDKTKQRQEVCSKLHPSTYNFSRTKLNDGFKRPQIVFRHSEYGNLEFGHIPTLFYLLLVAEMFAK